MDKSELKNRLYIIENLSYNQGKNIATHDSDEYKKLQEKIDRIEKEILDAVFPEPEPEPYQPKVGDGWMPIEQLGEFDHDTDLWGYYDDGIVRSSKLFGYCKTIWTSGNDSMSPEWDKDHQPTHIKFRTNNKPEPPKACQPIQVGDKVLYYDLRHENPIYAEVVMETGHDLHPYLVANAAGVTYAARREQLEAE